MSTEIRFPAMGSEAHVIIQGDRRLAQVARARIEDLERRWSRFIPDSEVKPPQRPSRRSAARVETFRLVERAVDGWRYTGGRFDPTVLGDLIREGYDRPFQAVVLDPRSGMSTR